jgi:hypothetical protein
METSDFRKASPGNQHATDRPKKESTSRTFQVFLSLFSVIAGALLYAAWDHFKPFGPIRADLRAYLLSIAPTGNTIEIQVAIVNRGNCKAALAEIVPALCFAQGGTIFQGIQNFDVSVSAVALDPGEIRPVRIQLRADPARVYHNAGAAPFVLSGVEPPPGDREVQVALAILAMDYEGARYRALWKVTTLRLGPEQVTGFRVTQENLRIRIFEEAFSSSDTELDLIPFLGPWGDLPEGRKTSDGE